MDPIDSPPHILRPWPFKGKGWLFNRFVPNSGIRRANIFGADMDLNLADLIQRGVYIGCIERKESNRVRRALGPGMTFVDIGANIGYFSLLAGSRVGRTGRVIAFEPNLRLKNNLAEAVAAQGCAGFEIHPIGLSDHEDRLTLHLSPPAVGNKNASMVVWDDADDWDKVEVPVRRLDDVLKSSNVTRVDLLKIDVQGHEKPVFQVPGIDAGRWRRPQDHVRIQRPGALAGGHYIPGIAGFSDRHGIRRHLADSLERRQMAPEPISGASVSTGLIEAGRTGLV